MSGCPFCTRTASGPLTAESPTAAAFPDGFPVGPGHTLVVPRRHVEDLFALGAGELAAVWAMVGTVREILSADLSPAPDGFNIGANVGAAAGQTVAHAHVHVIPRFVGDVADPRGGVRRVIPGRARYR